MNSKANAKSRTVKYFASKILKRLIGLMTSSFTVPQLNSFATIPAATVITNRPRRGMVLLASLMNDRAE